MYSRIICTIALWLIGVGGVSAQGVSASLSELVDRADRVVIGEVGTMRNVIERQVVQTRDGQPIMGTFVFTYVELIPAEHVVGTPVGKMTVRLLGGVHPGGSKFTTYAEAPSISSAEKVLLFLEKTPERGPDQEIVHQIAYHRAGKFRVEGEGSSARVVRSLPNSSLKIDQSEGIGEEPIPLERMKQLILSERALQR